MDENGTRFHLILGESDWKALLNGADGLAWNHEHAAVTLQPLVFHFSTPPGDRVPSREDRRGAGQDRYGNWYWIAENRTHILYLPASGRKAQHFWSSLDAHQERREKEAGSDFEPLSTPESEPLLLSGLVVTEHHYLIVGVVAPAGVLIFDLHAGGPPLQMLWPQDAPFAPFDMAPAPDGGVWILDAEPRYWALDRYFRVVTAETPAPADGEATDFEPADGEARLRCISTREITLEQAFPVAGEHAMAIVGLPDGTVLILESDPAEPCSVLRRYRFDRQIGAAIRLERVLPIVSDTFGPSEDADLWGHDVVFLPDTSAPAREVRGTLYIAAADGNQSFAFGLRATDESWQLDVLPHYLPMRRFSGVGLAADGESVSYHTLRNRWQALVAAPRPRFQPSASFCSAALDGKEPDCVWHRLFLDAHIPPGAEIKIESRAANSTTTLEAAPWEAEPPLYLRHKGSEIPYHRPFDQEYAQQEGVGTWETLFQNARGRYLQLRVTLRGTGRTTPIVHALRAYYPRFSYLREYLPAVYGLDAVSASFMERFLANAEGILSTTEGRIAQAQTMFDVDTIHAEYLEWLGSWFGVSLDAAWDERRRRLFLSHAMEMFNQRGTVPGLIRAIRLATDPCPDDALFEEDVLGYERCSNDACAPNAQPTVRIVERFLTRSVPGVVYGDPTDVVQPRRVSKDQEWTAADGAEPLHARYRDFLKHAHPPTEKHPSSLEALNAAWGGAGYSSWAKISFSPVPPSNPAAEADWNRFRETELGFTYVATKPLDVGIYQAFLARRYRQVSALNEAYQWQGDDELSSFDQVTLPDENEMPQQGAELYDWIKFVSQVLPIWRNAHRFTVLIPSDTGGDDLDTIEQRRALVARIVEIEKPAHAEFQVKPYWALFRVGEARLGLDTLLGQGSRFVALLLGQGYLAESYIAPEEP
jgi:phage tail-like protein